jgi:hypothetical protein
MAENGCTVVLPGREGHWLCLSGTEYQRNHGYDGKLCDFILFWHRPSEWKRIAVVELKGGYLQPRKVSQQLQAGADIATSMVKDLTDIHFAPVLLHSGLTSIQSRELKRHRIRFAKRSLLIQSKRCGFQVRGSDWVSTS